MVSKDEVNSRLLKLFGLFEGQPRYRVVWSDDETEVRVGKHEVFYGDIFVKEFHGPATYKKYSYLPHFWILEVRDYTYNEELAEPISYEPLFVMQDKEGKPLPLNWDVCLAVINAKENRPKQQPWNWKREVYEEGLAFDKDKKEIRKKLDAVGRDNMDWKWADKEAVFIPSTAKES